MASAESEVLVRDAHGLLVGRIVNYATREQEDTQKRKTHFAPYPEDLCKIPLLTTCPEDGIALAPFAGTGTTNFVAFCLGRKSVGIEVSIETPPPPDSLRRSAVEDEN